MTGLTTTTTDPHNPLEIVATRKVCQAGEMRTIKLTKVDVKLVSHSGQIILFDLITAKPNAGGFKEFKRTLSEWVAASLATDPTCNIQTLIAIPYSPYDPQPYNRWTMRGMLDLNNELKVGEEFWDFLGSQGTYHPLLDISKKLE